MRITAMSAVAPLFTPAPALVSAEHVHDLITEKMQLLRDLKAANVRASAFERAVERLRGAPSIVGTISFPDGDAAVYSDGTVVQMVTEVVETATSVEYVHTRRFLAPLMRTAADIVEAAETEAAEVGGLVLA